MTENPWIGDASRCCNCGTGLEVAPRVIAVGDEGEAACSTRCFDQHEREGCPFETGRAYRLTGPSA